jgi:hypothetical protein
MITKPFNTDVKAEMVRTHIGPYNAWLENGSLHIYGHQVGQAAGSSLSMTPEETHRFLEWLFDHQNTISRTSPHSH